VLLGAPSAQSPELAVLDNRAVPVRRAVSGHPRARSSDAAEYGVCHIVTSVGAAHRIAATRMRFEYLHLRVDRFPIDRTGPQVVITGQAGL
jgi:hypothetical protein